MFMNKIVKRITLFSLALTLLMGQTACQMEAQPTKIGALSTAAQPVTPPEADLTQQDLYQIGDIIQVNDRILVVLGWDQPPGGDLNPPEEGKKYLVVDLLIANPGTNSFNSSPVFQMTLKSPSGQKYNLNGKANAASGSNLPNGEVNPGEVIRGKVGFQVPADQTDFIFVYEANLIGLGEVSVDLGPTPVAIDPPEDLNLSQGQEVFQIGDLIEISDLVIQVLGVDFPQGTELIRPKEGYQFVAVDVQVENQGSSVQEITSIAQMYLKDGTGQKYTFHLGAQSVIGGGLPDDELQPGENVRGQIGFQVPEDLSNLIFVFDAEVFGFGKVFVALN
ncbi:MAG: DUF4352 domain-containing protein [Anaerolineales bacterium]